MIHTLFIHDAFIPSLNEDDSIFKLRPIDNITLHNVCAIHGGWCSVHREDSMGTMRDIMGTLGGVQYTGGYHHKCGEGH